MNKKEILNELLFKYINRTLYQEGIGVYFIKEQVGHVKNMKIEIYPHDHNPPHFHVKSNDMTIDAKFTLNDCTLLNGNISGKDRKRIEAFFNDKKVQSVMKTMWEKSH